jgi:hypothetical protein
MCGSTRPTSQQNLLLRKIARKQTKRINNWYQQNITNTWTYLAKKRHTVFFELRPWDHKIEIKEGFEPKSFKNYSLTLAEQIELDKFLKKNLKKGYIRPF